MIKISFADFVDLQSRLVLLPRVEEEGVGAIVASHLQCDEREEENNEGEEEEKEQDETKSSMVEPAKRVAEKRDDKSIDQGEDNAINPEADVNTEEVANNNSDDEVEENQQLQQEERPEDADFPESDKDKDSQPLKKAPSPPSSPETVAMTDEESEPSIIGKALVGMEGDEDGNNWLEKDFTDILTQIREAEPPLVLLFQDAPKQRDDRHYDDESYSQSSAYTSDDDDDSYSAGKKQVMENLTKWSSWGSKFAQEAASSASKYANRVKAQARTKGGPAKEGEQVAATTTQQKCQLYLQTANDFTPLAPAGPHATITQCLLIRKSAEEPCPTSYSYQWYRLCDDDTWQILKGATYAAYQPTATDVGYRLQCIVHDGSDITIFKTPTPILADVSLFNAARRSIAAGAQFNDIHGTGNAEGRIFRIRIELTSRNSQVISSTTIYQISGDVAEAIHEGPILAASAYSSHSSPKEFALEFSEKYSGTMLEALAAEEDGRLHMRAHNRITREMLLLALGVANYAGKPADLDCSTILYRNNEKKVKATAIRAASPVALLRSRSPLQEFFTPASPKSPLSPRSLAGEDNGGGNSDRVRALEDQMHRLVLKLQHKDKVIGDMQRQVTSSGNKEEKLRQELSAFQNQLMRRHDEKQEAQTRLAKAERRIDTLDETIRRLRNDHALHAQSLESRIISQSERIAELEKSQKSLQNEKAVLLAAVEARENKLAKMSDLQLSLDSLSSKVAKGEALKTELIDMSTRYDSLCRDLKEVTTSEKGCREQLGKAQKRMDELSQKMESEQKKREVCQAELKQHQAKTQTLKSERNSYKQKSDSLTKEINRLCRNGMSIRDIEKCVADEDARKVEVEVLKSQKRQALEDLHEYRIAYQQQLVTTLQSGVDGSLQKALEQKAELEGVVSNLTEYVTAKEMQMETMKEVNKTLSHELHLLAKSQMNKDEI